RLIARLSRAPFDLGRASLLRPVLIRLAAECHHLLLSMHHMVVDDWALSLLLREIGELYAAYRDRRRPELAELTIQYADYAFWERPWLQQPEVIGPLLGYWGEKLNGGLPQLHLRTDNAPPPAPSFRGASRFLTVSPGLVEALRRLARAEEASLFMVLLAGDQLLFAPYSGQTDILVGCPNANRPRVQTEALLGCFVNLLMLRTDLAGDPSLREVLARVRETCLGAYAHQHIPFLLVAMQFQPPGHPPGTPVFQALFTFRNTP